MNEPTIGTIEYMRKAMPFQLLQDYSNQPASVWMQMRVLADEAGRMDLVTLCIDMAAEAYEAEENQGSEQDEEIDCAALLVSE